MKQIASVIADHDWVKMNKDYKPLVLFSGLSHNGSPFYCVDNLGFIMFPPEVVATII